MSKTTIKVEKGVALPPRKGVGSPLYPMTQLEVGDSFFVPNKTPEKISGSLGYWRRKLEFQLAARAVTENGIAGVRVWRIA